VREFLETLAWVAFAAFLVAAGGAVLGGLLIWSLVQRSGTEPGVELADVFDGYDPDEPALYERADWWVDEPTQPLAEQVTEVIPVSTGYWPVPETRRLELLDGETVQITVGPEKAVVPWLPGGQHRKPESRCRVPRYLDAPQETFEFPQVGTHRTDEYPLLQGVSG
jgi:hypothetical protein